MYRLANRKTATVISTVFQKEWAEYKNDYRLRWIALILYSLFAVALFTGTRYYSSTSSNAKAAQEASYEQWLHQGKKNPHGAAHYGFYAYKPLSPMAIIDKGMESFLGQAVWLEAHNQNEVKEREATDAGSIVRFGYLSTATIFQALFPLCIVLLGFNLFSKEREGGTLPMLLSSGISAGRLLKEKAMALYTIVLILFLPMLLIANVSMLIAGGFAAWKDALPQMLLFTVFSLLYFAVWTLLSLYISSGVRQSSVALVGLLGFWVLGLFFIPRMGSVLAKTIYRTPSAFAFSHNVRLDNEKGLDRKTPAALRQKRFEDSLLTQYGVDTVTALPLSIRGLNLKRGEEYGYQIFEKAYGGLQATYRQQDEVMNWLNFLSPVQSMRSISAGLSGTGIDKQADFALQAERHRRLIATVMNDDITVNSGRIENYEQDSTLWQKIPPFVYTQASLVQQLKPQVIPVLSLLIWCGGLLLLLQQRAKRIRGL